MPFPFLDFKETLERCQETLEPYSTHLVDRRMSVKKIYYTVRYIGKEKEIEGLRQQISGNYQALQMCINFLQLWVHISSPKCSVLNMCRRLHLEATKQTQRLLDLAPFRAMSFGGQYYTTNALGSSSRTAPNALPPPSEAEDLYTEWQAFSRWLKSEDERLASQAGNLVRPLSLGGTPAGAQNGDEQTAAVLYHLRRELEDAIKIEENRAKREKRTNLSPSDAVRREVSNLAPIPHRTYTVDSDFSGNFSRFDNRALSMSDSVATIRPLPTTPSPTTTTSPMALSPTGSPMIAHSYFDPVDWESGSPTTSSSQGPSRTPSVSTTRSSESTSPGAGSLPGGLGISTAETTPSETTQPLRHRLSAGSLVSIALGAGALQWNNLCTKVQVERTTIQGVETRKCTLAWRYREDAGITIRSLYRSSSSGEVKPWIMQHFPATGPSIPLTISYADGDVSIEFPRRSYGRLEKRCTDIKYTFADAESSTKFQTLLYTNNDKDAAELLYDRPVLTISSNLHKPECRGKNLRLWKRSEVQLGLNGIERTDVLVILFYTSALPEEKAHWVEEPHYAFQWLDDAVYKKSSDRLTLVFSKEPGKFTRDKVFQRRKSSKSSDHSDAGTAVTPVQGGSTDTTRPQRSGTMSSSTSTSALSIRSRSSIFGSGRPSIAGNLNRFGYSELEIKFQSKADRKEFLDIWRDFVKPLEVGAGR